MFRFQTQASKISIPCQFSFEAGVFDTMAVTGGLQRHSIVREYALLLWPSGMMWLGEKESAETGMKPHKPTYPSGNRVLKTLMNCFGSYTPSASAPKLPSIKFLIRNEDGRTLFVIKIFKQSDWKQWIVFARRGNLHK